MSDKPQNHDPADAKGAPRAPHAPPTQQPTTTTTTKAELPKKQRPLAPAAAAASADPFEAPGGLAGMQIVDDDDAVMIPELAPDRIATASLYDPSRPKTRDASRGLFFRRTMIPVLLTCGLMLPALAALWFATDPDHVVRGTGLWLPVTFVVLGAVFLLLAVVNMAQVRHIERMANPPRTQR